MRIPRFIKKFLPFQRGRIGSQKYEIDPDEIFLDSENLPAFDRHQFEGRLEKPVSRGAVIFLASFVFLASSYYIYHLYDLQIVNGKEYNLQSEENHLRYSIIFPERGVIFDRTGTELVSNVKQSVSSTTVGTQASLNADFSRRRYLNLPGLSHLLGYVSYPAVDSSGYYYQTKTTGKTGVEQYFDNLLSGQFGLNIIEVNAKSKLVSQGILRPPEDGNTLTLSIDAKLQSEMYTQIKALAEQVGFTGGAGVMMDIQTGEILAMTSYPEFDSNVLAEGKDRATLKSYNSNPQTPFLNRAIGGLYAPGSIVKPFVAVAALNEHIISPEKQILSTGSISIPNPYDPEKKSIFRDWKAHGWVAMRDALAVSSDVYFYAVGGGFEDQPGLGIGNLDRYFKMFGLGAPTGINLEGEKAGNIPTPEWKAANFDGDPWRIGDTYITAIGQYGVQVTPIQMVRATAALVNGGVLLTPRLTKPDPGETGSSGGTERIPIEEEDFQVVREGMRQAVTSGIAQSLNIGSVEIAAKTGTAEIGTSKKSFVNSWVIGFFPYEHPRYAFTMVMEKGPVKNLIGSSYVMRQIFDWMTIYRPEYLK